jgi:hypothetical protein
VTIARSRKHIQTFYDTKDIGTSRAPQAAVVPLPAHHRTDVMGFNDIFSSSRC